MPENGSRESGKAAEAMAAATPIYKDPDQHIEVRVQDLLSRMTLAEKIGQMTQIERSVATASAIKRLAIGNEIKELLPQDSRVGLLV